MCDPFHPIEEDKLQAISWLKPEYVDVGCGLNPLPGSKYRYDMRILNNGIIYKDFCKDWIEPRNVYCRHVLEDLRYPENLLNNFLSCERGWIETPSPAVEYTRGIENLPIRGLNHHLWFIWVEEDSLILCPKFSIIEYFPDYGIIKNYNTYYKWKDYNFKYRILQNGVDFSVPTESYFDTLKRGIDA